MIQNEQTQTLTIDGINIQISPTDRSIVETAKNAGIGIFGPCHRHKQRRICCNSCIVEINGKQLLACETKPEPAMEVIVSREDLKQIRRNRLLQYQEDRTREAFLLCNDYVNQQEKAIY